MTEKDPGFIAEVLSGIKNAWPQISGAGLAVLICYGRLIYDGTKKKDHWIEPLLCGLITWAATSGISFGLELWFPSSSISPSSLSPLIGGAVGLVGVKKIRAVALKKLGVSDENQ